MEKNPLLRNERRKRGWSQKLLADFAVVSLSTIERAERGELLRIDNIKRLCECLEKTPEELGLVPLEQETAQPLIEKKRETYLIATPNLPVSALISNYQTIMPSETIRGTPDVNTSLESQSFLDFGILDRLGKALTPRPKIDLATISYLKFVGSELKKQLIQGKPTNWTGLLSTAINQLSLYTNFLESNIERNEQIILLIGETCLLIGDVLFNMRNYDNAKKYYEMTLQAAHEAQNVALQAIASGRYGLLLIDTEMFNQAEQLLEHALHLADENITSVICSWLWAVKAEAYAGKQEEKSCNEALESAKNHLSLNNERMECYIFNADLVPSVYGITKLLGFEGACYLRLKQPSKAQQVLTTSQQLSFHAHHQSIVRIDFAKSLIQQGSPEQACTLTSQALDYIKQTGSKRAFQRILSIRQDLHRWNNLPEVRELDERITLFSKEGA